ncbi:MAG: deaminase [Candidatus Paceibacterota bacterium]|jgi:deoxycytidylate deaminase
MGNIDQKQVKYVLETDKFMKLAREYAERYSTDRLQPVGSVIVKNGEVVGGGANKMPINNHRFQLMHARGFCIRRILHIPSGKLYWLCPGCGQPRNHSERRAIRDAVKRGMDIDGADLYLWGHFQVCETCRDAIMKARIKNVFLLENSNVLFKRKNT